MLLKKYNRNFFLFLLSYSSRKDNFEWWTSLLRWKSFLSLIKIRNKYYKKRCFIIGNGPSLNNMDLTILKNEYTFGVNRIYLLFPKIGFQTSFLVVTNNLVLNQFHKEILNLDMLKFINWNSRRLFEHDSNTIFFRSIYDKTLGFSKNPQFRIWEGGTVTYVAIQLALYMGFTKVILIGVDHNFYTKGEPHKMIISDNRDSNHFDPNYFGKGVKWNLPDLEMSEQAFKLSKEIYKKNGCTILDATINGKLNIFEKIDYSYLFFDSI